MDIIYIDLGVENPEKIKKVIQLSSKKNPIIFVSSRKEIVQNIKNVTYIELETIVKLSKIIDFKNYFLPFNTDTSESVWKSYLKIFILSEVYKIEKLSQAIYVDLENIILFDLNQVKFSKLNAFFIFPSFNEMDMNASFEIALFSKNLLNKFETLYIDIFMKKTKFFLIDNKVVFHNKFGQGGINSETLLYLLFKSDSSYIQNLFLTDQLFINKTLFYTSRKKVYYIHKNSLKCNYFGNLKIQKRLKKYFVYDNIKNEYYELLNINLREFKG